MMISFALTTVLGAAMWLLWRLVRRYVLSSPLDNVPGPRRSSLITGMSQALASMNPNSLQRIGNLNEFYSRDGFEFQDRIDETYGGVVKINGLFGVSVLVLHITSSSHTA
jgi:hypothetical protein